MQPRNGRLDDDAHIRKRRASTNLARVGNLRTGLPSGGRIVGRHIMHFTVYCLDQPNMVERRLENYDAHKAVPQDVAYQDAHLRAAYSARRRDDDWQLLPL